MGHKQTNGHWWAPLLLAVLLLLPARALAQAPAVVEELKLVTADETRATFYIRFSPNEPDNATVNANPTRPELIMRETLRAPRVPARSTWRGLVRATTFQSSDSGLALMFETNGPAKATVEPAANSAIQVVITRLSEAEATGSQPLGSSGEPVVPASEIPSYVDYNTYDSYELVPLKYADVSEIIGLLVPGEQIQPNNVFIRREPGALAAGNESDNAANHSPARAEGPNIFTVSAFSNGDKWASFSNYGPNVDFAEPGVSIKSTWLNGGYYTISGTSMAAPHFAGLLLAGQILAPKTVLYDPDGKPDPIGERPAL